jgi:hypothetical protein
LYIVNCRDGMHTPLDKWVDGRWVRYLTPIGAHCLSAPIVVEPGATLTRRVEVSVALPGHHPGGVTVASAYVLTERITMNIQFPLRVC